MEIEKTPSAIGNGYDIILKKDGKTLSIVFARVLDLYMAVSDGNKMPRNEYKEIDFDIDIDDGYVYTLFDNLYNDIINCNIMGDKPNKKNKVENHMLHEYNLLVDKDKNINWVSDDGIYEEEDMMKISKLDNSYKLTFIRTDKRRSYDFKSPEGIYIRFSNSGSRYSPFNVVFMRMYQEFNKNDIIERKLK